MDERKKRQNRERAARFRARKREAGVERFDVEIEVPTLALLRQVGRALGRSISEVVSDLCLEVVRDGLAYLPSLRFVLPSKTGQAVDLYVEKSSRLVLMAGENLGVPLSAGGVVEHLVVDRLTREPDGSLTYQHPGTDRRFLTGWFEVGPDSILRSHTKYQERNRQRILATSKKVAYQEQMG